jgi:hypothetical protein
MIRLVFAFLFLVCCSVSAVDLEPGVSVFGEHEYVEYIPGNLPLVIAAPHGGRLTPDEIPNRTSGVTDMDANTQELARTLANVFQTETGHHIHLVICRLHRSKLDANRDRSEAAQGSEVAQQAWKEHHGFIERACATAVKQYGVAFLIDLHGHGHPDRRLELGYMHGALALADCDEALNEVSYVKMSSLRWIVERSSLSHTELLRGPQSLGALLEDLGYPSTPSPRMPVPTEPYFRGGYTIARHCRAEHNVTGLQIEANRPRLRDTAENRLQFSRALVKSLSSYLFIHLGIDLHDGGNLGLLEQGGDRLPTRAESLAR